MKIFIPKYRFYGSPVKLIFSGVGYRTVPGRVWAALFARESSFFGEAGGVVEPFVQRALVQVGEILVANVVPTSPARREKKVQEIDHFFLNNAIVLFNIDFLYFRCRTAASFVDEGFAIFSFVSFVF